MDAQLLRAAQDGDEGTVERLLASGADPNVADQVRPKELKGGPAPRYREE